ncbi:TlpA disulfide reductase family protein [Flavihumibacter sp. ZG627]|uniref:TlpA family protein disulfide reductase n=1 Tax=Flavihumibacter sp. ZG627 TaxID=1463156 RepID=UPI00155B0331|nr:TlpA disulfide reductase family protein [Flavihumibacter sp. ZG627]
MLLQKMIALRLLSLTVVLLFISCKEVNKDKQVTILPDTTFEKIKLADLKSNSFSLKQYAGKTIFLNFWATWCKPCIAEMPTIEKAQNILNKEEIVFLIASGEAIEEIEAFRKAHDFNFNYCQIQNSEELGFQALPTTYIFNAEGDLVFSESGYRKWDEKNNIDMILKIVNKNE